MKNWKRILAALLALAMLFSMAAISEEQIVPEAAGEQAQVEEQGEDGLTEEAAEEAAEEPEGEEATQEPVEDEPADAMPAAPKVVVAPEWEYDAEIGAITIPYVELPETLTFEWSFDGEAAQYAVQTAPVPEGDNPEQRCERIYTTEPHIELPAADYAEGGWFSLYVVAVLEDGKEIEGGKFFRLEQQTETEDYAIQQFDMSECEEYGHEWGWDDEKEEGTGVCEVCGAVCKHKKSDRQTYTDKVLRNDITPVQYDSLKHITYYDVVKITYCTECFKELNRIMIQEGNATDEYHDFYLDETYEEEGDVCNVCGFDRSKCKHTHVEYFCNTDDDAIYQYKNDDVHLVTGNMSLTARCMDCDKTLYENKRGYFENIEERHYLERGKCTYCGAKSKCLHLNTDYFVGGDGSLRYYIDVNKPDFHYCHVINGLKYCIDCGATIADAGGFKGKNVKEDHVYLPGSKVCLICGCDKFIELTKIKFSKSKLTVKRYSRTVLKPTFFPKNASNRSLDWTSSDESIATVEDGVLRALKNGTVTITCTAKDGSGQSASCSVTVNPVPPKSIKIITSEKKVNVGGTLQLYYQLSPENSESTVKWSSSKPKIATIDPKTGLLTALSRGNTTITAKTANKKKKTLTIQVLDPNELTGVTLNYSYNETVPLNVGETLQLTATLQNDKAQSEIEWLTNNPDIATVEGGLVTPHAEGKVKITVRTVEKRRNGSPATASVTIKVTDPYKPTGFKLEQTGTVKLYRYKKTLQLNVLFEPAGAYSEMKWESSKPKIATVENGVVTALKTGTTRITATAKKNKKLKATVTVKVIDASTYGIVNPFPSGRIRSGNDGGFIPNRYITWSGGQSRGAHLACDYTPVNKSDWTLVSIADGVVQEVHPENNNAYGCWVAIRHKINGKTVYSRYQHMVEGSICIKEWQKVKAGQKIGVAGSTGNVSGAHLHLTIFSGNYTRDPHYSSMTNYELNVELKAPVTVNGITYYNPEMFLEGELCGDLED